MTYQLGQTSGSRGEWVVDSPAVGTELRPAPCGEKLRPARPELPGRPLALTPPGARRGVLTALATDFPTDRSPRLREWRARFPEHRSHEGADLAHVPTVFDKLDERLCGLLVYRGWWLTGAALALYHPDLLGLFESWVPPEV